AAAARTDAGLVFASPLSTTRLPFGFANNEYTAFCRLYLGLPPLTTIGDATHQPGFDYKVQKCTADHKSSCPFLDAQGDHAASGCPATKHARYKKHTNIIKVL